jgi:hypothetical protein
MATANAFFDFQGLGPVLGGNLEGTACHFFAVLWYAV